jgi:DNA topoisomerase-1
MKNLLILESPNKVKKVQGYVGTDYIVSASKGHIRTLGTQKTIGIDIENNFEPKYHVDPNKRNVVKMLEELQRKCGDTVYIATDFDREGEAIGWHIIQILNVSPDNIKRLVFKEITKKGLQDALEAPVALDMNMVHSQQARMVLDKLIGYKVSPVLWKQFNNYKLSAGRVQSVVVKLINEREGEIAKFQSSNFYKLTAQFSLTEDNRKSVLETECETRLTDVNEVSHIINNTDEETAIFKVTDLKKSKTKRKPSPPFTTSSLQQEASNKLGMSPDACMKAAQKLYEQGLITYMRTDSLALSDDAMKALAGTIKSKYGDKYYKYTVYNKKKSKGAQEAHEACRPTDLKKESVTGTNGITARENRLYQLIWRRTMACQMSPADVEIKSIKVGLDSKQCKPKLREKDFNSGKPYTFIGKFEKILFDGFLAVYNYKDEDEDEDEDDNNDTTNDTTKTQKSSKSNKKSKLSLKQLEKLFASLKEGQQVWCNEMDALEKQTKCPNARYTEASLIKKLEELGIGRPSTYASMVTKVQDRGYVEKRTVAPKEKEFQHIGYKYPKDLTVEKVMQKVDGEKNKMFPTNIGVMVTDFLIKDFTKLMDYGFTALVEAQLDEIATGSKQWHSVVNSVWIYLSPIIDQLAKAIAKNKSETGTNATKRLLGTHPQTDNEVYVMSTRYGWSVMEEVSTTDKKKNKWASLPLSMKPDTVTLDECLTLFVWPKKLGNHRGKEIELCKAKSVYLKYDGKNYNLIQYCNLIEEANKALTPDKKKTVPEPETMTKKECLEAVKFLDNYNQDMVSKRTEKVEFNESSDVVVRNGPYGYYIKYLEHYNVPLPAKWKKSITGLTYKECVDCIGKFINKRGLKVKLKEQLEELNSKVSNS